MMSIIKKFFDVRGNIKKVPELKKIRSLDELHDNMSVFILYDDFFSQIDIEKLDTFEDKCLVTEGSLCGGKYEKGRLVPYIYGPIPPPLTARFFELDEEAIMDGLYTFKQIDKFINTEKIKIFMYMRSL